MIDSKNASLYLDLFSNQGMLNKIKMKDPPQKKSRKRIVVIPLILAMSDSD